MVFLGPFRVDPLQHVDLLTLIRSIRDRRVNMPKPVGLRFNWCRAIVSDGAQHCAPRRQDAGICERSESLVVVFLGIIISVPSELARFRDGHCSRPCLAHCPVEVSPQPDVSMQTWKQLTENLPSSAPKGILRASILLTYPVPNRLLISSPFRHTKLIRHLAIIVDLRKCSLIWDLLDRQYNYLNTFGPAACLSTTYIQTPVLSHIPPKVPPNESIAIGMIESFVLRMLLSDGPYRHVGDTLGSRFIVAGVVEELVAWEAWNLAQFFADQHVERERDGFGHSILCDDRLAKAE